MDYGETFTATTGNDSFAGNTANTEFVFSGANLSGTDTITDSGGSDRLTFTALNSSPAIRLTMKAHTTDSSMVTLEKAALSDLATVTSTINVSRTVERMLASDEALDVAQFGSAIELEGIMNLSGTARGYITVGSTGGDTIDLNSADYANLVGAIVFGLDGNDTIHASNVGSSMLNGGAGDDVFKIYSQGVTIFGKAGTDTVDFSTFAGGALTTTLQMSGVGTNQVSASYGTNTNVLMDEVESVVGTSSNDTITVNGQAWSSIDGGNGDDTFNFGGSGTVTSLVGGAGSDSVNFSSMVTPDGLVATLGATTNAATLGATTVINSLTGVESLQGTGNADTLTGSSSADTLIGGGGNDTLTGGDGSDSLLGGAGEDVFVFKSAGTPGIDTIGDFHAGASGEKMVFDLSDFGMTGETLDMFKGAVGSMGVTTHPNVIILTGTGYADMAAAAGAIGTTLDDVATGTTTGGFVFFADSDDASGVISIFHTDNVTNAAGATMTEIGKISGFDANNDGIAEDIPDAAAAIAALDTLSAVADQDVSFQA